MWVASRFLSPSGLVLKVNRVFPGSRLQRGYDSVSEAHHWEWEGSRLSRLPHSPIFYLFTSVQRDERIFFYFHSRRWFILVLGLKILKQENCFAKMLFNALGFIISQRTGDHYNKLLIFSQTLIRCIHN